MNPRYILLAALLAAPLRSWAEPIPEEPTPNVEIMPESRLWLVGDSTLHAYAANAKNFDVGVTLLPDGPVADRIRTGAMKKLYVRVPVAELSSGKTKLDKNMSKALKAEEHPDITFHLTSYEVGTSTEAGQFPITVQGQLTVGGQARPVELVGHVVDGEPARIRGEEEVLMTDHGITPPSFMGAIKTHNRVIVNFDLFLK